MSDELILRNMIRDESEAVAHYTEAIEKAVNPQLKEILTSIRDEEKVHIGELECALKQLLNITDVDKKEEGYAECDEIIDNARRIKAACQTVQLLHNQLY